MPLQYVSGRTRTSEYVARAGLKKALGVTKFLRQVACGSLCLGVIQVF